MGWPFGKKKKKVEEEKREIMPKEQIPVQVSEHEHTYISEEELKESRQVGAVTVVDGEDRKQQLEDSFDSTGIMGRKQREANWKNVPGIRNAYGVCQQLGCQYNSVQHIRKENAVLKKNYESIQQIVGTVIEKVDTLLDSDMKHVTVEYKEFWQNEFRPEIYRRLEDMGCQIANLHTPKKDDGTMPMDTSL